MTKDKKVRISFEGTERQSQTIFDGIEKECHRFLDQLEVEKAERPGVSFQDQEMETLEVLAWVKMQRTFYEGN